jgi:hypothetical protein
MMNSRPHASDEAPPIIHWFFTRGSRSRLLGRNDDAIRRVGREKSRGPIQWNESCRAVFPSPVPDACDPRDTSRQSDTHSNESREVRYPWHPWHARAVAVHEAFTRNGRAVCRCGVDENPGVRLLEFEARTCDRPGCRPTQIYRIAFRSRWCGLILSLIARLLSVGGADPSDVLAQQSRQQPYCFPSGFWRQHLPRRALLGWMKQFELSDSLLDE